MYKFSALYRYEEPDPELSSQNRFWSGLGAGAATFGGMHAIRKGVPWAHEKLMRGITANKGYKANLMKGGFNKVLGNRYAGAAALTLPVLYNMFLRKD